LKKVSVNLGPRSYTIHIGKGLLDRLADMVRASGLTGRVALVTDSNVLPLYGEKTRRLLSEAGFAVTLYEIAAGEESKNLDRVAALYRKFLLDELDRTSGVIALGGGVVGDVAGFIAATYMRGIPHIQVPTTLLAQVDSSVGGKVGVNLPEAKNIVGSFYQPRAVIIDPSTLGTLPEREFRAGIAEVVKCGVIADPDLFGLVESRFDAILAQDHDILGEVVGTCCKIKAGVVERDETERGERVILNYGHTIGHAIEAAGGYDRFLHGEAIAIGMNGAARIAAELGLADQDFVSRQARVLGSIGLPTGWSDMPVPQVLTAMRMDKKRSVGTMRFVLPCEPGQVTVREGVDEALVTKVLETLRSEADDNG
jgi:3-dehydroquinate synthase